METGADSVADSDNINTSTPWKLRFIKSPVVSSPICKQDDSGFDLFVSGLQDKVSAAEQSLKKDSAEKIHVDATREEGKTLLSRNKDKGSTSTNVISIACCQTTDTLLSAKLWKPVDTSCDSFIVLDETIMSDDASEEYSFQKSDENCAKNISGILPLNDTAKLIHSSIYDATKLYNARNLILDATNDGENGSNLRSISSDRIIQNVTSVTTGQNNNENTPPKQLEKNASMQHNHSHFPGIGKSYCASISLVTNELELNATSERLPGTTVKSEQVTYPEKEGDKLSQIKYGYEETGKTEQIKCDNGKTELMKSNKEETGILEQVKSDKRKVGMLEQVKYERNEAETLEFVDEKTGQVKSDKRETGKSAQVKSENLVIEKNEQVKPEREESEKLKSVEDKTQQVKSDKREAEKNEQVKSENLETVNIEQVKSEREETQKLKSVEDKIPLVKPDKKETEKEGQVKSENLEIVNVEQVKSEREETQKLKSVEDNTQQVNPDKKETEKDRQVKSENLPTVNIEQVKSERKETQKLKSVDKDKTQQVKSVKRETEKNEQVKSENLRPVNFEQVKSESEEFEKLKSVDAKTEQLKLDNSVSARYNQMKSENLETENMEQVKSEREETELLMSVDGKSEQIKSDDIEPGEIEEETSDNLELRKTEYVKPDSGDFVSSDPEENADNNNPEWELLKKLETDEERYKAVRLRWRNLVIPNPNKNLTYRSRGYWITEEKQKQVSEVKQNPVVISRKRTHSADPIEHQIPAKRQRTFSCTEVFDRKMIDIHKNLSRERNAILQQHERAVQNLVNKTNHQLRSYPPGSVNDERIRALHVQNVVELRYKCDNRLAAVESESMSKLRTLEKAMEEVRVFNTFYQGLEEGCDDALLLTDEQLMEVLEEDHLYECFAEFYNG